ncbi:MAG: NifB/NifX family molybdenum-iron cluster-binding protein [Bacilli bacterium]
MKLSMPINDDEKMLCVSFGRAPKFLIVDTETNEKQVVINTAADAAGGAGIAAAQILVNQGVQALVTPRLGTNSAEVLQKAKIMVFKCNNMIVDAAIREYNDKKLTLLTAFHPGFHHGSGNGNNGSKGNKGF